MVSRAVYMTSMVATLNLTFMLAGASLVGQLAGCPRRGWGLATRRAHGAGATRTWRPRGGRSWRLRQAGGGRWRDGVRRDERRRGGEGAECASVNLHRQQVHAGCLVLLKVRAWTAGLRQVDGVVGVAARHLGAEVVEILGEGHAAALCQVEALRQPVGVGAGVAALRTRELLCRVHAGLLPAQGVRRLHSP